MIKAAVNSDAPHTMIFAPGYSLMYSMARRLQQTFLCLLPVLSVSGCGPASHFLNPAPSVTLGIFQPTAGTVTFHSSLNQFKAVPVQRSHDGSWLVSLSGTESFRYFFIVDGKVRLPDCPFRENDDFEGETCIYSPGL